MKIGFIGVGNMGSAIMKAVLTRVSSENVYISDANENRIKSFSEKDGTVASDNQAIAECCDYIFLGVKPQMMADMLKAISPALKMRQGRFVLISMAAGLEIATLREMLGEAYPIIRIMPNLPVSVGEGMTLYDSVGVEENEINAFLDFMGNTGKLVHLAEKLIDAGCSVSGCGPAFMCLMIEAMSDAGVKCGLTRMDAATLATQTMLGTAKLLSETETHPALLKDAVCSPGGSTIVGVEALENGAFRATVMDAVVSAYERNRELGKK
ncbi:MAG: pyrroline-5-carboxylate reductase [Clostridia bacterium]|nr:pyrroline-5-carboxylate reductase [Clostridia bacterium]